MPKKLIIFLFIIFILFPGRALAWQIDNFEVNLEINKDSSVLVTEKIEANFSGETKHGIYRNIPVVYKDETGKNLNFDLQILSISDENGLPWQYSKYYSGANLVLKIGSPNTAYNTIKTFLIKYRARGALLYLEGHDELFWNALGTEWDCPINNVVVNVTLPESIKKELLLIKAYSGRYGARLENVESQILDEEHIAFRGGYHEPYEGLTVVVGWPKGIVEVAKLEAGYKSSSSSLAMYSWLTFFILLIIPLTVFLVMFSIWKAYGKDPKLQKSIVVEYKAPEELKPAEIGTLIDDKIDIRDISSTIIDLAVRGYIKIIKEDKIFFQRKYSFEKLKEFSEDKSLRPFERIVLEAIFKNAPVGDWIELSDLENNFYKKLSDIKDEIFKGLMEKGFYRDDPEKTVKFYRKLSIAMLVIAFFMMNLTLFPLALSIGLSGIIILMFAKYMPAKTKKGTDAYAKVLGFEEFLMRTDKEKIKFEVAQGIFEKMLPYAICLGISSLWAKIFADIYNQPPAWFSGDYSGGFILGNFMHDLNSSLNSMNHSFVSAPRSVSSGGGFGGGGFSGGGFGGGGGSSW